MNKLPTEKRVQVVSLLVEGMAINAIVRTTGISKNTILKLLADLGNACAIYQSKVFQNLNCQRLQVDEIWTFCFAKRKNLRPKYQNVFGYGDVYTWVAVDADTKLVPSWFVGRRDAESAMIFIQDLASRLANRVQLTSDGHRPYLEAIEANFGCEIDYAMLVKMYRGGIEDETRYSPADCIGARKETISGDPDPDHISTSYVERQNLTMRMSMRRFTRLTNAHSKKIENHIHAISLHYMFYNFARYHQSLRCSPAMAAGVAEHLWSIEDIVKLMA